ncbi:hypothetical protein FDP22_22505 (plasmid) [Paroceanicella profunda]|uniref:DUF1127 domain-containing protein n=1 Tax=Paroceanicella profunda TaxID=2579971 RepID=A0A5B8G0K4_9RHOB|nr:hypothetical protein [Paroceanicella profunda]QDL94646.1 hypothetical protein FDP22_22505 [Paroceanicella profunda]
MTCTFSDIPARPGPNGALQRIASWRAAFAARSALRRQQRLDRAAFRGLLYKDEWVLRDLGVTRHDVEQAAGLPLSCNAAEELQRLAQWNRRSGM